MSIRNLLVTASLVAGLAACGSGPQQPAALNGEPRKQPNVDKVDPGVETTSLTCDKFPVADVAAATSSVIPSAQAEVLKGSGYDDDPHTLSCQYNIFMPGTDTRSADRGLAIVTLQIADGRDSADPDPVHQRKYYEEWRESAMTGDAPANQKLKYSDVSGIGAAAYLQQQEDTESGTGRPYSVAAELAILRERRPFKIEINVHYSIPRAGDEPADKALDVAIREDTTRAKLVESIAGKLLPKIG